MGAASVGSRSLRTSRGGRPRQAPAATGPRRRLPQTSPLGPDDVALLGFLAQGLPLDAVARRMRRSERTVRRRIRDICDRLGVSAPIQAVVWAARRGML